MGPLPFLWWKHGKIVYWGLTVHRARGHGQVQVCVCVCEFVDFPVHVALFRCTDMLIISNEWVQAWLMVWMLVCGVRRTFAFLYDIFLLCQNMSVYMFTWSVRYCCGTSLKQGVVVNLLQTKPSAATLVCLENGRTVLKAQDENQTPTKI